MTREELLEIIADVRQHKSELDDIEVKAARGGTPRRIYEPLSAFANHAGGGVILFGLDENDNFNVVGVGNPHRLQEEIAHLAASELEPALRPEFTVEEIDGHTVVAVEINEILPEQRPCFYKPAGLQSGSYIRVGNTNRQMTNYEIFGYVSARTQPTFDEEVVRDATLEDLDRTKLESFISGLRRTRPQATYLNQSFERVLIQRRIIREVEGVLRPTLTGLLMFGIYPQGFEPQLVITFLQYFGTTETEPTPTGARFLDNQKFEGTIPDIAENTLNYVLSVMSQDIVDSFIVGVMSQDIVDILEPKPDQEI